MGPNVRSPESDVIWLVFEVTLNHWAYVSVNEGLGTTLVRPV